jgi:hypothetical protein
MLNRRQFFAMLLGAAVAPKLPIEVQAAPAYNGPILGPSAFMNLTFPDLNDPRVLAAARARWARYDEEKESLRAWERYAAALQEFKAGSGAASAV